MTYMKSVNEKFWTWVENNERLAFVLLGAIGLPLFLALGGGVMTLLVCIFMWFGISMTASILITSLMVLGAIGGLVAYNEFGKND